MRCCIATPPPRFCIRPDAEAVHFNLGINLLNFGQNEEAGYHFARVLELDPSHSWAELRLGNCLFNSGKYEESISHFERALELDPTLSHARNALRMALVKVGRLEQAAEVWKVALDDPRSSHGDIDGYAELCLFLDDEAEYQRTCEMMLARFGDKSDPFSCERIGRACLLKPSLWKLESSNHIRRATELIDRAMATELRDDQLWVRPYIQLAKALSEVRLENYDNVMAIIHGDVATTLPPTPDLLRGIALCKTGKLDEAKRILDGIQFRARRNVPATSREDWLVEILFREVSQLRNLAP
ncbi:tetratricopeptide repeat protein [Pirellulaceae bacterium SH501]